MPSDKPSAIRCASERNNPYTLPKRGCLDRELHRIPQHSHQIPPDWMSSSPHHENAGEKAIEHRLKTQHGSGDPRNNPSHGLGVIQLAKTVHTPAIDCRQEQTHAYKKGDRPDQQASLEIYNLE